MIFLTRLANPSKILSNKEFYLWIAVSKLNYEILFCNEFTIQVKAIEIPCHQVHIFITKFLHIFFNIKGRIKCKKDTKGLFPFK